MEDTKQGHWIFEHSNLWRCSVCGEVIYSVNEDDKKRHHAYCGACGAKMKIKGEKE